MNLPPEAHPYPPRPLIQPQPPAVEAHAKTGPCLVCGEPVPVIPYRYVEQDAVCPVQEAEACVLRAMEKGREAAREAAEKAAAEPEPEPEVKAAPRRPRASAARKAALGQVSEPPPGDDAA